MVKGKNYWLKMIEDDFAINFWTVYLKIHSINRRRRFDYEEVNGYKEYLFDNYIKDRNWKIVLFRFGILELSDFINVIKKINDDIKYLRVVVSMNKDKNKKEKLLNELDRLIYKKTTLIREYNDIVLRLENENE